MEYLFVIKKFVAFFVEPLGMILLLALAGWYFLVRNRHTKAKLFLTLAVAALFVYSYPPFSDYLIKKLETHYPMLGKVDGKIAYIHVLGHGNNDDRSQPITSLMSGDGIKRVVEGVMLQKKYPMSTLIFTGYEGSTELANAKVNGELARALGVEEKHMIINPKPRDTQEEALFTKSIVGEKPFILVTSATHMPRAVKLFEALGMHPIAAPTAFRSRHKGLFSVPTIEALGNSQVAVHEYIGAAWADLVR